MEIMRKAIERSFRCYHNKGLTPIMNFTDRNHIVLTDFNRSKIEIIRSTNKKRWFRYYRNEGLTTITNFTKLNLLYLRTITDQKGVYAHRKKDRLDIFITKPDNDHELNRSIYF